MSTFVLNRNYGLALPTSYVEVDNEEMEYVDGGGIGKHWYNSTGVVGTALDVVIIAVTGEIGAFSTIAARKYIKSIMGKNVSRTIARKLTAYVGSAVAGLFTSALNIAMTIGGTSLGGIIAEAMDRVDGKNDGYIFA